MILTEPAEQAQPQQETKPGTTYVLMLVDASGSMHRFVADTIGGVNRFLDDLAADHQHAYEVTVTLFSSRDFYHMHGTGTPDDPALQLDHNSYITKGLTALYDATGRTITDFIDTHNELGEGDKVIMVTTTDGEENNSTEWSGTSLQPLISNLEKSGRWSFQYLQTGMDGWAQAQRMGYSHGSTVSTVSTDSHSVGGTYTVASKAARSYAGGMSVNTGQVADWMEEEVGKDQVIRPKD